MLFAAIALAGALGEVGEPLGTARIVAVEVHPEFERVLLEWEDKRQFSFEATRWDSEHKGLCTEGAVSLFPRPELVLSPAENWDREATLLCGRLGAVQLQVAPALVPVTEVPLEETGVLKLGGLLVGAGFVWLLWRARAAALWVGVWSGLALGVRLCFQEGIFNGGGAAYEKLVLALGGLKGSPYGMGYPAILELVGVQSIEGVFRANLLFSVLAVGLVWGGVAKKLGKEAAHGAALLLALYPGALAVARTEDPGSLLLLLGACSFWAVGAGGLIGGLLMGLASGLAWHVRPEALVLGLALVGLGVLEYKKHAWKLIVGGSVGFVPLALLLAQAEEQHVLVFSRFFQLETILSILFPHLQHSQAAFQTVLNFQLTSPVVALLGLYGLYQSREWLKFGWLWACLVLPFTIKVAPLADAIRLQLLGVLVWVPYFGLGLLKIRERYGVIAMVLAGALLLPWVPGAQLGWVNHQEWWFLRETLPEFGADRVVYLDPGHRALRFREVMERLSETRWSGGGDLEPGRWVYKGLVCYLPEGEACREIFEKCAVREGPVRELSSVSDNDIEFLKGPTIGFYQLVSCEP